MSKSRKNVGAEAEREFSRSEWARRVKQRDGQVCRIEGCNRTEQLEAHHIVPLAQGGKNTLDNGVTLCHRHHCKDFLRVHIPSKTPQKKQALFDKQRLSKRDAARRFLMRRRLTD